jgi:hypothetical protein
MLELPQFTHFLKVIFSCNSQFFRLKGSYHKRILSRSKEDTSGKETYSASHSRVAPENVGLHKEQKYNTFAVIPVMKCGCVFWAFAEMKLATRKDKKKLNSMI